MKIRTRILKALLKLCSTNKDSKMSSVGIAEDSVIATDQYRIAWLGPLKKEYQTTILNDVQVTLLRAAQEKSLEIDLEPSPAPIGVFPNAHRVVQNEADYECAPRVWINASLLVDLCKLAEAVAGPRTGALIGFIPHSTNSTLPVRVIMSDTSGKEVAYGVIMTHPAPPITLPDGFDSEA
jgi:hypothetical protein